MRNFIIIIATLFSMNLVGQQMSWEPSDIANVKSEFETDCAIGNICYDLMYIPQYSGKLTSYDASFVTSCKEGNISVIENRSLIATDNSKQTTACEQFGSIFLDCSANSGSLQVVKGQEVNLHQVCFKVSDFSEITFEVEPVSGLTVSLDMSEIKFATDIGEYLNVATREQKFPCKTLGTIDLDLVQIDKNAMELTWNPVKSVAPGSYDLYRSINGFDFKKIKSIESSTILNNNSITYLDQELRSGDYTYEVRFLIEDEELLSNRVQDKIKLKSDLTVFPNPSINLANLIFDDGGKAGNLRIYNVDKKLVHTGIVSTSEVNKLDLRSFSPGIYIIKVEGEVESFQERLIVIK